MDSNEKSPCGSISALGNVTFQDCIRQACKIHDQEIATLQALISGNSTAGSHAMPFHSLSADVSSEVEAEPVKDAIREVAGEASSQSRDRSKMKQRTSPSLPLRGFSEIDELSCDDSQDGSQGRASRDDRDTRSSTNSEFLLPSAACPQSSLSSTSMVSCASFDDAANENQDGRSFSKRGLMPSAGTRSFSLAIPGPQMPVSRPTPPAPPGATETPWQITNSSNSNSSNSRSADRDFSSVVPRANRNSDELDLITASATGLLSGTGSLGTASLGLGGFGGMGSLPGSRRSSTNTYEAHRSMSRRSRIDANATEIWPEWIQVAFEQDADGEPNPARSASFIFRLASEYQGEAPRRHAEETFEVCEVHDQGWMRLFIAKPSTSRRLLWDLFGLTLIFWDLIWLPLQAFDPPNTGFPAVMQLISIGFWSLDLPSKFFVGYNRPDGMVEMRFHKVAVMYLSTWFLLDIAMVTLDWISIASGIGGADLGVFRTLKSLRMSKSLRLLRLFKLFRLAQVEGMVSTIAEHVNSIWVRALCKMVGMIGFVLIVCHFVACGWYSLASGRSQTWLDDMDGPETSDFYYYTTALHWSLTQFTPASMPVTPVNLIERVYNIAAVLFGLLTFTQLIGNITSTLTELKNLDAADVRQKAQLRQFLTENPFPVSLVTRIWGCVNASNRQSQRKRILKESVQLLKLLPKQVLGEVNERIYWRVLATHPFLSRYVQHNPAGASRLYGSAFGEVMLGVKDELFLSGECAEVVYFIVSGELQYSIEARGSSARTVDLAADEIVCEVALWVPWMHHGSVHAEKTSYIVTLDAQAFRDILCIYVHQDPMLTQYAKLFCRHAVLDPDGIEVYRDFDNLEDIAWCVFAPGLNEESLPSNDEGGDENVAPSCWTQPEHVDAWHEKIRDMRTRARRKHAIVRQFSRSRTDSDLKGHRLSLSDLLTGRRRSSLHSAGEKLFGKTRSEPGHDKMGVRRFSDPYPSRTD